MCWFLLDYPQRSSNLAEFSPISLFLEAMVPALFLMDFLVEM